MCVFHYVLNWQACIKLYHTVSCVNRNSWEYNGEGYTITEFKMSPAGEWMWIRPNQMNYIHSMERKKEHMKCEWKKFPTCQCGKIMHNVHKVNNRLSNQTLDQEKTLESHKSLVSTCSHNSSPLQTFNTTGCFACFYIL